MCIVRKRDLPGEKDEMDHHKISSHLDIATVEPMETHKNDIKVNKLKNIEIEKGDKHIIKFDPSHKQVIETQTVDLKIIKNEEKSTELEKTQRELKKNFDDQYGKTKNDNVIGVEPLKINPIENQVKSSKTSSQSLLSQKLVKDEEYNDNKSRIETLDKEIAKKEDETVENTNEEPNEESKEDTKEEEEKTKGKKYNFACVECRKAHKACSNTRPCTRCVDKGIQDRCQDVPRKRKRDRLNYKLHFHHCNKIQKTALEEHPQPYNSVTSYQQGNIVMQSYPQNMMHTHHNPIYINTTQPPQNIITSKNNSYNMMYPNQMQSQLIMSNYNQGMTNPNNQMNTNQIQNNPMNTNQITTNQMPTQMSTPSSISNINTRQIHFQNQHNGNRGSFTTPTNYISPNTNFGFSISPPNMMYQSQMNSSSPSNYLAHPPSFSSFQSGNYVSSMNNPNRNNANRNNPTNTNAQNVRPYMNNYQNQHQHPQ